MTYNVEQGKSSAKAKNRRFLDIDVLGEKNGTLERK